MSLRSKYTEHLFFKFSTWQQLFVLVASLYAFTQYRRYLCFGHPLLAEGILQIVFTEINRWQQVRRQGKTEQRLSRSDVEKDAFGKIPTCVACVVGYREDPAIFEQCVQSYYKNFDGCTEVSLIGIDGDLPEDEQMVRIVRNTFGEDTIELKLKEPLGRYARARAVDVNSHPSVISTLISQAIVILKEHGAFAMPVRPFAIIITQPHLAKKEIMFTTFIFALALAKVRHIEFIWSSDSDSWIYPSTLSIAVSCMSAEPDIAGSCTQLNIHNGDASVVAKMVAATYEGDMALTRGFLSAFDTVDCQAGPCAIFRSSALESILVPWYNQKVLGQRPVVNEDRHLTTRLLLDGGKVTFNPLVTVATDTPTTIARWIAQQIRWSRATAIETLFYPELFIKRHPVLFIFSLRRMIVPIVNMVIVYGYLLLGQGSDISSWMDLAARLFLCGLYSTLREGRSLHTIFTNAFAQIFLQLPQAAFLMYAAVTAFESSWGTSMRSQKEMEKEKERSAWRQQFGGLAATAFWICSVSAAICRYVTMSWLGAYELYGALVGFSGMLLWFIVVIKRDL